MKTYKLTTFNQVKEALRDGAKVYLTTARKGYKRQILKAYTREVCQYQYVKPRYVMSETFDIEMSERGNEVYASPASLALRCEVYAEV